MYKVSRLFWPLHTGPIGPNVKSNITSRSQRLMLEMGLIKSTYNGTFQILTMAQRSIDKCIQLLENCLRSVGGQKISLPIFTSSSLWKQTGRLDGDITEFYIVRDRHNKEFLLSPTHEEAITSMLSSIAPISYRQLPLKLFQIGVKFRDEVKPRYGLIRAKEFLMKDMYTFDKTEEDSIKTYEIITKMYSNFFDRLQVPYVKVEANTGIMGGYKSHEFHYLSTTGEDKILHCSNCDWAINKEISVKNEVCPNCHAFNVLEKRGIEVGHTFLLGDKYTRALGATFLSPQGKPEPMIMGCYGIGVTRLIAAAIEVLSSDTKITWPTLLAPFDICIISPKDGSKEFTTGHIVEKQIYYSLSKYFGEHEILLDDRTYMTIGKRLLDAKRFGFPLVVVIGSKCLNNPPKVEIHLNGETIDCSLNDIEEVAQSYLNKKNLLLSESLFENVTTNRNINL